MLFQIRHVEVWIVVAIHVVGAAAAASPRVMAALTAAVRLSPELPVWVAFAVWVVIASGAAVTVFHEIAAASPRGMAALTAAVWFSPELPVWVAIETGAASGLREPAV